jgi:hypothetical protein
MKDVSLAIEISIALVIERFAGKPGRRQIALGRIGYLRRAEEVKRRIIVEALAELYWESSRAQVDLDVTIVQNPASTAI